MTDQVRIGIPPPLEAVVSGGGRLVGREGFVERIGEMLRANEDGGEAVALIPTSVSLHGMGGVGKTALALEFCYSPESQHFETIWWVNAESELTLDSAYQAFRRHLQVPDEIRGDELRALIDRHVAGLSSCLIVYDNVQDKGALNKFLPENYRRAILATSRSSSQWAPDSALAVDVLALGPSRDWLLNAAGVTQNYGDEVPEDSADYINATWLAGKEAIDGLALALRMATTFIRATPGGLADYRRLYESSAANIVDNGDAIPANYPDTVYATFAVSLSKLVAEKKLAAKKLLEIASFYAPDDIPTEIFTPESLDGVDALTALQELANLALIRLDLHNNSGFSIHRLVQEVTRYYLRNLLPEHEALAAKHDITVLVVSADPPDAKAKGLLDIEGAVDDVQKIIAASTLSQRISNPPVLCAAATNLRLANALNSDPPPDVVVVIGHAHDDKGIALRDSRNTEEIDWVPADKLPDGFSQAKLVILASCYNSGIADALAAMGPTVVGTTDFIRDSTARDLVWSFLDSALGNRELEHAFQTAKDALRMTGDEVAYFAAGKSTAGLFG